MPPLNLVGDFGGGGMFLAYGVVCALLEAQRSGQGQVVDAAMVDGAATLMTMFWSMSQIGHVRRARTGARNLLDTGAHFYDVYRCADGEYVSIGSIEPQFYAELLRLTGLEGDEEFAGQMDKSPLAGAEGPARRGVRHQDPRRVVRADGAHRRVLRPGADDERGGRAPAQRRPLDVRRASTASSSRRRRRASAARPPEIARPPAHPGQHTREVLEDWGIAEGPSSRTCAASSATVRSPIGAWTSRIDLGGLMATIVFVHAHPDDEASSTGGSMARAAAEGHRVVLVVCTNGELRRVARRPRRRRDARRPAPARRPSASARVLGVARVVWLGYRDSGMTGWEQNDDPGSFWQADLDEAAERLAAILREEQADVVVLYDWHGGYGHPDHIQVHRVGHRAADLAGTPKRFEVTLQPRPARRAGWPRCPTPATTSTPTARPTTATRSARRRPSCTSPSTSAAYVPLKREALAAHASQVTDIGMFLAMPDERLRRCASGPSGTSSRAPRPVCVPGWLLDGSTPDGARPPRPPRSGRCRLGHRSRPRARRRRARAGRGSRRPARSARPAAADRDQPVPAVPGDGRAARPALGRDAGGRAAGRRDPVAAGRADGGARRLAAPGDGRHVDRARRRLRRATATRVVGYVAALGADTVVVSHFVAINAVIGACLGDDRLVIRSLDNTSVTVVDTTPAAGCRSSPAATRPTR